ncbi:hypothetical protein TYRP_005223, partial [Tyrophagus putrescentiae]
HLSRFVICVISFFTTVQLRLTASGKLFTAIMPILAKVNSAVVSGAGAKRNRPNYAPDRASSPGHAHNTRLTQYTPNTRPLTFPRPIPKQKGVRH